MPHFDFRELIERLPLVVYIDRLDDSSSPLYVSPEIERLLGYTREEWLADPDLFSKSLHPEDQERVMAAILERNRSKAPIGYADYRLIARDGRVVWVRDDEVIVGGENGAEPVSQGYMQDVTSRRRDSMRLELLVGILGLAAEERTTGGDRRRGRTDARVGGRRRQRHVRRDRAWADAARALLHEHNGPLPDTLAIPGYIERLEDGPIVVADVTEEAWLAGVQAELDQHSIGSAVDVPLRRDGQLVGVLWFNTPRPRNWDAHEVTVLSDVAEQLATVLGNAEANEERRRAERDLRSRDAILEAVSHAAEHFLKQPLLDTAMADLMRALGEATGASRAYVFENLPGEGAAPFALLRAAWSTGDMPMLDDPRLGHLRPAPHFPRWAELLAAGEALSGHVRELPDDEREPLELVDALSVVAVPVFVDGTWWGFIGFEDCEHERDWSAAETDALRAAAGLVAAAISRERVEHDLRRRDAILEAVSHTAGLLVAEPNWRDAADDLLKRLGIAAEASRAYLFECGFRADGKRIASQRFEWVAGGTTAELDNPLMQDMCFDEVGLARLARFGERNELFAGKVRDFLPEERAVFDAQGILAVATVPVFVDGMWWGFIGFDDCETERTWSPAELDALRTASSLLAAAVRRERSETVLREHEQKLRAVFETALDAIFITDDERRYVDVNPAGCEYLGVAKRDLIGRRIDEFVPPSRLATIEADWAEYIAGGPMLAEWESRRRDGTVRVAEASARPNFLPGLHIAFFRDVTERKRLEAELLARRSSTASAAWPAASRTTSTTS